MLESLVLLNWCERNGYGPLGITGLSMGGHMASLAATNWPKPLVLVPCLSWSTASAVFTQGVMSQSINWDVLETQYFADGKYREKLSKMVTIVDDAFLAGQSFIRDFSNSVAELRRDITDMNTLTSCQPEAAVNLEIERTSPATPVSTGLSARLVNINAHQNQLNLSENLLSKLLSTEKTELTCEEVDELNFKIKLALERIKAEDWPTNSRDESSKEVVALQSDTSTTESSTLLSSAYNVSRTKLMSLISPYTPSKLAIIPSKKINTARTNWWEHEALQFMRGVMDECTHLKNFSVPYDTSLITAICAKDDAYVPREGCSSLEDIWPGAEVRYLDAGHVSAYVLHQKLFRSSIVEAFERAKRVYDVKRQLAEAQRRGRIVFDESSSLSDRIKELQVVLRP